MELLTYLNVLISTGVACNVDDRVQCDAVPHDVLSVDVVHGVVEHPLF